MDHASTMRRLYELLSAGDIDGFGELVAEDFVEHEETPGSNRARKGSSSSSACTGRRFPICEWTRRTSS